MVLIIGDFFFVTRVTSTATFLVHHIHSVHLENFEQCVLRESKGLPLTVPCSLSIAVKGQDTPQRPIATRLCLSKDVHLTQLISYSIFSMHNLVHLQGAWISSHRRVLRPQISVCRRPSETFPRRQYTSKAVRFPPLFQIAQQPKTNMSLSYSEA